MRLIDADALKANVPDTSADIFENCRNCKTLMDWQVKELIDQQPTAVVRCGECKWYQPDLCANPWGVCFCEDWVANNIGHTVDEDGFCYRGERKVQE